MIYPLSVFIILSFCFFCCFVLITPWPPYQNFIFSLTVVEADSGIQTLSEGKIETHFAVIWRWACKALSRSYSDIRWLLCITAQLKGSMQSDMSLLVGQHYSSLTFYSFQKKNVSSKVPVKKPHNIIHMKTVYLNLFSGIVWGPCKPFSWIIVKVN